MQYVVTNYSKNLSTGWIVKMKLSDLSQLDELMDEAEYNDFVKETEDE